MAKEQTVPNLDDPIICQQTDSCGAYERIFDLGGQCQAAWQLVQKWQPPVLPSPPQQIIIAGMGGSAIGGDILRALTLAESRIPISIHRDYDLPAWAGPQTLVIASSYSGNTEETLSAAEEAHRRGAPLLAVTTGGTLAKKAQEWKAGLLTFNYPAQPREALGYGVVLLLGALARIKLLPDPDEQIRETVAELAALSQELALTVPADRNLAKEIATWVYGCLPLVYGAGLLAPVARRWKGQFNENSKSWAGFEELPEMDHNAVTGTEHPASFAGEVRGIFLTADLDHPRNRLRQEITRGLLEKAGASCRTIGGRGRSGLAQMLTCAFIGDAASYYLAMLYRADPTAIPNIKALKEALAKA